MKRIVIVDYQSGNLHSVERAIRHVSQHQVIVSSDSATIESADAIVFPGQGAAEQCMAAIQRLNLTDSIQRTAQDRPFLGICMGLQVLMSHSEEDGGVAGLNLIKGKVERFKSTELKIPHIGWNEIKQMQSHPMWHHIDDHAHFYFVHSYYVQPEQNSTVAGVSEYGEPFCAAVAQNQLFAIQAHPEKSGEVGLKLLKNFNDLI